MQGLLDKFRSYRYISLACTYLDVLEKTVSASKIFEGESLLPFEIKSSIKSTVNNLQAYANEDDFENDFDSHLHRFYPTQNEDGKYTLASQFNSPGDTLKTLENRQPVIIKFDEWNITSLSTETALQSQNARAKKKAKKRRN